MGLFDLFKKKEPAADEAAPAAADRPAASSWAQRLARFGDLEDEDKLALCQQLLGEIAPRFDNAKIKPLPDDDEIELRGRVDDIPFRVNIEYDMGWVRPEMKITNRTGEIELERDHDKIPKERDDDDDWADEDELRVFVARGIFVEGDDDEVNETLSTLQQMPPDDVEYVLAQIEQRKVTRLYAHVDALHVTLDPNVQDMADPVAEIVANVEWMKFLAQTLAAGQRDMSAEPRVVIRGNVEIDGQPVAPTAGAPAAAAAVHRVKCGYCSTLFVHGANPNCPNCGAPYTG